MLIKYKDFKTLSKNNMKQIKGGDAPAEGGGYFSPCPVGETWFISNSEGCGTRHFKSYVNGWCSYTNRITQSQPCGWA